MIKIKIAFITFSFQNIIQNIIQKSTSKFKTLKNDWKRLKNDKKIHDLSIDWPENVIVINDIGDHPIAVAWL